MRLVVTTFLTLDGVMQAPGGPDEDRSGGFGQGGWLAPFFDDDLGKTITDWFSNADAFLLGRRTYEIFAGYWPDHADESDPVSNGLNVLPKHVASTTLTEVTWQNSSLIEGDVPAAVAELKRRPGRELQVHGSGVLARSLADADLVDEYRLVVFPVVLGEGRRLFSDGTLPTSMRLVDTRTTGSGVVCATYEPAGRPEYATVGE